MTNKMTDKQQLFVKEYLIDLNATEAAKRAGYTGNSIKQTASQILDKTRPYIQKELDKRANKVEITAEKILNNIVEIEKMAREQNKFNESLKANELLGKHLKLFTDRIESTNVNIDITDKLTDEQLEEQIKRLGGTQ